MTGSRTGKTRATILGDYSPSKVAPTTPDGEKPWSMDGLSAEEITEVRVEVERMMREAVGR